MKPALQMIIARNEHIQDVIDHINRPSNLYLIQYRADDTHIRIIYEANEEQAERFNTVLENMVNKLG